MATSFDLSSLGDEEWRDNPGSFDPGAESNPLGLLAFTDVVPSVFAERYVSFWSGEWARPQAN